MIIWRASFMAPRPLASLPNLRNAARERIQDASYMHFGRYRQSEDYCLFKYTLSGEGCFADASGVYRVPQGSGFLCAVNDPASEYRYPPDASEPWDFVYICFGGPAAKAMTCELIARNGPLYKLAADSHAIQRLLSLGCDGRESKEISAGEGAGLVCELLAALEASASCVKDERDASWAIVRKAKKVIEECLPEGIEAGELASALEVSREHLSRCFVRQTGVTIKSYINRRRMLCACQLLKDSDMTVSELSSAVGIRLPQHFTRLFKRTMKMTPLQFRRYGGLPNF